MTFELNERWNPGLIHVRPQNTQMNVTEQSATSSHAVSYFATWACAIKLA